MKTFFGAFLAPTLVALSIIGASPYHAAAASVVISLDRQPDGDVDHFLISPTVVGDVGHTATFVAPDGTTFGAGDPPLVTQVGGMTAVDLISRFSGRWTLNDTLGTSPGSPVESHQFILTGSNLLTGYLPFPAILAPADGQVVFPDFDLAASVPNFRSVGITAYDQVNPTGTNQWHVSIALAPDEPWRTLRFRAVQDVTVPIGTATPVTPNPTHLFDVALDLNSLSARHTVTAAIPEPSSLVITVALFAAPLIARRGGKFSV